MPDVFRILRRVSAMPLTEIADRVREHELAALERIGMSPATPRIPDRDVKGWLRSGPLQRFYPGVTEANAPVEKTIEQAESIWRHEFQLLGLDRITLPATINWHQDPYTGNRWEVKFWADYKPQDDSKGRDVKIIHELNRHQHLPRLAAAYLWTGEERYAAEALAQIESWIEQNPVGQGINWQSSLELAIRSVSWLWTIFPLLNSQALTEAAANHISHSLFGQLDHVYRHLSRYTSPNTHLIGEAAALYIAGVVFDIERWAHIGAEILNEETGKQVLDGAVYGELSSWYHCYTIDFYLQAIALGRRNNRALAAKTEAAVEGMIEFLMHLTRPNGTIPMLGDDDGGRAFPLGRRDYRCYRDALAIGAVLFNRPDFKYEAHEFSEEVFWLLGNTGCAAYRNLTATAPQQLAAHHPSAGYSIVRSGWDGDASHLVFDTGGLGILSGGHAHADALSINLSSHGRPILIDPATYIYNCQPQWRDYFRSTAAHNTAVVDGESQIASAGTFAWKSRLNTCGSRQSLQSPAHGFEWIEGEHNAYAHHGVTHRRSILAIRGEYFVIVDRFAGLGTHQFDLHYHFNPAADPQLTAGASEIQGCNFGLSMHATAPIDCSMHIGETNPILGWASNGYGELHPIPTVRARLQQNLTASSAAVITIISLGAERPRVRPQTLDAGYGLALIVESKRFSDVIAFSPHRNRLRVGTLLACGEFFWARSAGSEVVDAVAVSATRFEFLGINLFEDKLCALSAAF